AALYRDRQFFGVFARSTECFVAIELNRFRQRCSQRLQQRIPSVLLALHARNFLDPADPDTGVLLYYGCVPLGHGRTSYAVSRKQLKPATGAPTTSSLRVETGATVICTCARALRQGC